MAGAAVVLDRNPASLRSSAEHDLEGRSATRTIFKFDGSTERLQDSLADCQAHAEALTLGREKGLEKLGLQLIRNAQALILHY